MFFPSGLHDGSLLPMITKLVFAVLAGGVIGWEREMHGRPAGLRTHVLVSAGSCLMMIISEEMFLKYGDLTATGVVRIDPGRMAAQVITGIGFLGAGVIIKEGLTVRGLTTAASLWMMSGIGMAFGVGMTTIGIFSTILASCVLIFLKKTDGLVRKDRFLRLYVLGNNSINLLPQLTQIFDREKLVITNIEQEVDIENKSIKFEFTLTGQSKRIGYDLTQTISAIDGVQKIKYR